MDLTTVVHWAVTIFVIVFIVFVLFEMRKIKKRAQWTCHICNKKRDDEEISVLTYPLKALHVAERKVR